MNVEEQVLELECLQETLVLMLQEGDLQTPFIRALSTLLSCMITTLRNTMNNDSKEHLEQINSGAMM